MISTKAELLTRGWERTTEERSGPRLIHTPELRPAPGGHVQTTFERYEVKYWVPERTARVVEEIAAPYLMRDPFSLKGGPQENLSLYLDSFDLVFYKAHVARAFDRWKLRVRTYRKGTALYEIKRKTGTVGRKTRAGLPDSTVPTVLAGAFDPRECPEASRPHLEAFMSLALPHRAEPKLFISARREAFVSRSGDDVRITFDREMRCQAAHDPSIQPDDRRWRDLRTPPCWLGRPPVLVEIKVGPRPPAWVGAMVSRLGLQRVAFSKYVTAVSQLGGGFLR